MSPGPDFSQEEYDSEMDFIKKRREENRVAVGHIREFGTNNQSTEATVSFLKTRPLSGEMLSLVIKKGTEGKV